MKPYLNETAVIGLEALQDLEELASMDIVSVQLGVQGAPVDVESAPVNVQGAPVNVQRANVLSAAVDLNAPVNALGTAPENIQSAPSTGGTPESTFQSATVPVQGQ